MMVVNCQSCWRFYQMLYVKTIIILLTLLKNFQCSEFFVFIFFNSCLDEFRKNSNLAVQLTHIPARLLCSFYVTCQPLSWTATRGFFFSIKTQNGFAWPNSILSLLIFNLYPSVRILHKLEHPLDSCQQMNVKETNSNIIHQVAELHVIHYWRNIFPLGSECHLRKIYKFTLIDYRGF